MRFFEASLNFTKKPVGDPSLHTAPSTGTHCQAPAAPRARGAPSFGAALRNAGAPARAGKARAPTHATQARMGATARRCVMVDEP
jgi:hypothetical protein